MFDKFLLKGKYSCAGSGVYHICNNKVSSDGAFCTTCACQKPNGGRLFMGKHGAAFDKAIEKYRRAVEAEILEKVYSQGRGQVSGIARQCRAEADGEVWKVMEKTAREVLEGKTKDTAKTANELKVRSN